jgi:hypothetical protein
MWPVQKEIQDEQARPVTANHSAILWPGKMVDSVHDLRQRLQDIDLDQITNAVEHLSELQPRLLKLQRALWIIGDVSACQPKVHQAQDEMTRELNRLKVKILEALSQLQRNEETTRLLVVRDLEKGSVESDDQSSVMDSQSPLLADSISSELESAAQLEAAPLEIDQPVYLIQEAEQGTESLSSTEMVPAANAAALPANVTADYNDPIPDSPTVGSGSERPDFGFLKRTPGATRDFDFTDDVLESNKGDIFEEPHELFGPHAKGSSSQDPQVAAPDTMDFDKKLLDDLIKNYGEFAVSPEFPRTVELSNPSEKPDHSPAPKVTSEPDTAINRSVPASQIHGDFDRKLKKLIKDYGQVDLYSQHTSGKTKLRALAVFAVLGAVLSGIYYFSAPKSAVAPSSAPNQSQASEAGSEHAVTDNSPSVDTKTGVPANESIPIVDQASPQTIEAGESFAITDKQGIKKKIKKGGSKQ